MSLSQTELVESESEWRESVFEWIWEKKTRSLNPTWQSSRWLPSSIWVRINEWRFLCKWWEPMNEWSFFVQMVGTNLGKCEWVWEEKLRWLNPRWWNSGLQNSKWLPSWSSVRINEWSFFFQKVGREVWVKFFWCKWWEPILASVSEFERKNSDGWIQGDGIQDYRIQDGCHHQVRWEWMSLSQIELVWIRVRVEWECFWVNLREDNKVSESKMAVSESKMAEFMMAAIIKFIQNEWVKFFSCKWWEPKNEWSFFVQMVGTNLGKCEWVWEEKLRWLNPRWWNSGLQNSRWLPSSS